jgi:hypothetical protein
VKRFLLPAFLAACAYSNEGILAGLEAKARQEPAPFLDRSIDRGGAAPILGALRATTLPMVDGKVPAVLGRLNGIEMVFALDTGTSAAVLTAEAARDAGLYLPPREPESVAGPGYVAADRLGAYATLELGPNRFGPGVATVAVNERPGRWMRLGTESYAIVGCAVLSHFRVTFDFAREEVRLVPTGRDGHAEPLFTRVEIHGKPYMLLIDSGATAVFLEPWVALELDLISPERARRHETKAGRLSDALFTRFTLDTVGVPGRSFRDVEAAAVDTFGGMQGRGFRPGGLLGLAGFGKLVWTLDYGTRTLHVDP